jgi:nucleotide-binding universal stress UspA family protein
MSRLAINSRHAIPAEPPLRSTSGDPGRVAVVVVGLDGSSTSWDAFYWACGEARRLEGRAVAVYVTSVAPGCACVAAAAAAGAAISDCSAFISADTDRAAELEAEARRNITADLMLTFLHVRGDTATELVRVARAVEADLIVVGRSTKILHHLSGALGRRLMTKRMAPAVVIVP